MIRRLHFGRVDMSNKNENNFYIIYCPGGNVET